MAIVEFWQMGHEMAGRMAWQGSWTGCGKVLRISATLTGQSDSPWRGTYGGEGGVPSDPSATGSVQTWKTARNPSSKRIPVFEGIVMCLAKLGTSQSTIGHQSPTCLVRTASFVLLRCCVGARIECRCRLCGFAPQPSPAG